MRLVEGGGGGGREIKVGVLLNNEEREEFNCEKVFSAWIYLDW